MTRSVGDSRRWLRLLALLMGLSLIAAACGGDDGGEESEAEEEETPSEQEAPEEEGDPVPGGSATFALEAETNGGYCLQEAQLATAGIQVARSVYDTLTAPDENGEIQPYLAESVEPNEDATVWTITLREGITFHDGSELTAEVVKNNLDAYRGAYEARSPLLFIFVFDPIESVEVVDPLTVQVNMKQPWVAFDWTLWGSFRVGMTAQAQLDSEDCANEIIGTGPFAVDSWTVGEQMVLSKNENYWRTDDAGNPLPRLDELIYTPIPEAGQRSSALEAGQVQILQNANTEQIADRLQPLADSGEIELLFNDRFSAVNYIMYNVREGSPFANKNARLAVAHGLDRRLLDDIRGAGLGTVADQPFAEEVTGYVEDPGFPQFDQALAEEFAAAYQDETGESLEFTYSTTATESSQLTAQEIQGQLSEVGITMNIDASSDQATLINVALSGEFDAIGWRNHPGADPDTQYNWWYTGSPVNFGGFSDPEIDAALDEGRTNTDQAARVEAYENLSREFASEVYNLWTTYSIWSIASSPDLNGIYDAPLPDGGAPFPGLETGVPVEGLWLSS